MNEKEKLIKKVGEDRRNKYLATCKKYQELAKNPMTLIGLSTKVGALIKTAKECKSSGSTISALLETEFSTEDLCVIGAVHVLTLAKNSPSPSSSTPPADKAFQ